MKTIIRLFLQLSFILPISSCSDLEDCFKSTGSLTTEERVLQPIHYIELHNNVDVVYHYDSVYHMRVTAGSHLLDKISTSCDNGRLVIRNHNRCNWMRSFNPTLIVDVWAPSLDEMLVENASGNVTFADTNKIDFFLFNSFGSIGTYKLLLDCNHAYLKQHTGPSDIYAAGKANDNILWNAGDGRMYLNQMEMTDLICYCRGSNDMFVNVHNKFQCDITSIGNVYYSGNPIEIHSTFEGKGKLIPY